MKILTHTLTIPTCKPIELIEVTDQIKDLLMASELQQGQVTIISRHTTAFVNINEYEERLLEDMEIFLKRLVPKDGNYLHNISPLDGRHNAHSHLMGLFMNSSESIPFADGKLLLGQWQSIFFVELDGPRPKRELLMQIAGV
uniref:Secondary thiamine-phosphate synthase enzyme n=1 Tax=Chlorobium chlorochromatii (strain CaD3) TaxID=340177 RepID=Q3AQQ0_CHLCH